jgi:transcriptional regulator with XRE-family HTH domain
MIGGMITKRRVTNEEFGQKVGCDFTMASRLRNGQRLPSRERLEQIVKAYGLDGNEALQASAAGPKAFSVYLKAKVFEPEADEPEEKDPEE